MREEELLISRLKRLSQSGEYPFHMPGHKRLAGEAAGRGFDFPNPFTVDITEITGFDNLHHPEGILRRSMEWAAGIYGADRTYYLINGSSGGLLAAVCGCVPQGGRILMARNCHKAVYNAVYIGGLEASYVYPQEIAGLGIQGGILPQDVEKRLAEEPGIAAVLIVSPTYDGVVSDVERIAEIAHRAGLPLIVDEAHGAHFCYSPGFPVSALELGADVVVQSVHKTLPSLTQTALLHMKANRPGGGFYCDAEAVERFLHIYQSSSPSYVLMASIENAIYRTEQLRGEAFDAYLERLTALRERLAGLRRLRLAGCELVGTAGVFDFDCSKLVVAAGARPGGAWLFKQLSQRFGLELEMCGWDYVTAISTVFDSEKGLWRLSEALEKLDAELERDAGRNTPESGEDEGAVLSAASAVYSRPALTRLTIAAALSAVHEQIPLERSGGRICAEFVYIYPPGIPLLAPGEVITPQLLEVVRRYIASGLPVQGPADEELRLIRVIGKPQSC